LPQINPDSLSLQENFDYFHDLLEAEDERRQPSAIGNYGYITAFFKHQPSVKKL
jgi:hypothetical protein